MHFLIAALIILVVVGVIFGTSSKKNIICPHCGYRGEGREDGGPDGCLLILFLCFGIVPGLLYLFCVPKKGLYCPHCGCRIR